MNPLCHAAGPDVGAMEFVARHKVAACGGHPRDNGVSMFGTFIGTFIMMLAVAVLSSALTLALAWKWMRRSWQQELERRLRELHEEVGRTAENRARRAVADALADINAGDVLRDATWKAARSGSDLLSDRLSSIFGKRRRLENDLAE